MKIPSDKRQEILDKINSLWKEPRNCPICSKNEWSIDSKVFQLVEFHEGKLLTPGVVKPLIGITCNNCSYTFTMNAILLGIVKPSKEQGDSNE